MTRMLNNAIIINHVFKGFFLIKSSSFLYNSLVFSISLVHLILIEVEGADTVSDGVRICCGCDVILIYLLVLENILKSRLLIIEFIDTGCSVLNSSSLEDCSSCSMITFSTWNLLLGWSSYIEAILVWVTVVWCWILFIWVSWNVPVFFLLGIIFLLKTNCYK